MQEHWPLLPPGYEAMLYPGSSDFGASSGSVSVQVAPDASLTTVMTANATPLLKQDGLFTISVAASTTVVLQAQVAFC